MREIKFRAWNKSKQHMDNWKTICKWCDCSFIDSFNKGGSNEDDVLMQFTGLLDKSGKKIKEIYEGDIVRHQNGNFEVFYDNNFGRFEIRGYDLRGSCIMSSKFEVIGNVWENPELLKRGESEKEETE